MATFKVKMERVVRQTVEILVEAPNDLAAMDQAELQDVDYNEGTTSCTEEACYAEEVETK